PELAAWAKREAVTQLLESRTATDYVSKLSECFKWAVEKTYMTANPAATYGNGGRRSVDDRSELTRRDHSILTHP
ncbi:MAG TPA: hypothetical protein VN680_18240, partial [Burkholderiaceae bacterium]|nr:hypothetical protein [Burkholderiaceae bacterium]